MTSKPKPNLAISAETATNALRPDQACQIGDLTRSRAVMSPGRTAFRFIGKEKTDERTWYALDLRARAVACRLQSVTPRDARVILALGTSPALVEALLGCLYAGRVAVPIFPPSAADKRKLDSRIRTIYEHSRASAILAESAVCSWAGGSHASDWVAGDTVWLNPEAISDGEAERWFPSAVELDSLALLQYTSGSTGSPKGVMLTHRSLMHSQKLIQDAFGQTEESVIVNWLPLYHDMGLIGNVLHSFYCGATCILLSPASFSQRPGLWLEMISRYRATTSGGPNFAYHLCARNVTAEEKSALDLSSWKVAFNGAEPIRPETLDRFTEVFEPCGFRREAFCPCYGLAEAGLLVSGGRTSQPLSRWFEEFPDGCVTETSSDNPRAKMIVSCGRPQQPVTIVDPQSQSEKSEGSIGEVWVSGEAVGQGYWSDQELTSNCFAASLKQRPGQQYLRTGDLGFVHDGELYISGRFKDLIVIRGRNHFPQDIENTVELCDPSIPPSGVAAFAIEFGGEERVAVVVELRRRDHATSSLINHIRQAIAKKHGVSAGAIVLVRIGGIPRTTSNKVRRHACKDLFLSGNLPVLLDWKGESCYRESASDSGKIVELPQAAGSLVFQSIVALIDHPDIAANTELNPEVVDSLAAIRLKQQIEWQWGIELPILDLLGMVDIPRVAERIRIELSRGPSNFHGMEPQIHFFSDEMPLSYAQRSLWFLHQMAPTNTAYNIAAALETSSDIDSGRLRRSFEMVSSKHSCLRSSFTVRDGEPLRRISPQAILDFEELSIVAWPEALIANYLTEQAERVLDLDRGPLLCVRVLKRGANSTILLAVVHHLIADLWSLSILLEEVAQVYEAQLANRKPVYGVGVDFDDWLWRESSLLQGPEGESLRGYWHGRVSGFRPELNLPSKGNHRPGLSFSGATHPFNLPAELSTQLKALARQMNVSCYTLFLASLSVLLHRYTGQKRIMVGSPFANRARLKFERVVGMLVNTLPICSEFVPQEHFSEAVLHLRSTVSEALEHQDFPLALIAEKVHQAGGVVSPSFFDAFFAYQNLSATDSNGLAALAVAHPGIRVRAGEIEFVSRSIQRQTTQFDLTLSMSDVGAVFSGFFQYSTERFFPEIVARIGAHFQRLLESVVANPECRIGELSLLLEAERRQVVHEWNRTGCEYGKPESLPALFEQQAALSPERLAVIAEDGQLNYGQLNRAANRLAHSLKSLGVGPESIVAVYCERSVEMVVSLIGILKSGAAYLPIDHSSPPKRLRWMLENARPAFLLITGEKPLDRSLLEDIESLKVGRSKAMQANQADRNLGTAINGKNAAYVLYTSGSTGKPKAVVNTHEAICNRLNWMQHAYRLGATDCVLHKTPLGFDVSVWEVFWPLLSGACMAVARPEGHRDPAYLADLIARCGVTVAHFVPSMLNVFLEQDVSACRSLRHLISSGESLSSALAQRAMERLPGKLHNLYGPTEAAVDVTSYDCEQNHVEAGVSIGRPIANTQIYLLDREMEPVPSGVVGEIYIGGIALARGYLGSPELTADRFVPDVVSGEPGKRLYRTGDLARYAAGGNIEFLGRDDYQVKIRGVRIEVQEIERELCGHPEVKEAVVVVRELKEGDLRLVAYIVPRQMPGPSGQLLRTFLAERLPEFMIPARWLCLPALPLTTNGKLDREALPIPAGENGEDLPDGPRAPIEKAISKIWSELLGVPQPDINDTFFAAGGHSLLMTQAAWRIQNEFNISLSMTDFFTHPTIAELSSLVAERLANNADKQIDADGTLVAETSGVPNRESSGSAES